VAKKRQDRREMRATEARKRQVAHDALTPREILRALRDERDVGGGPEFDQMVRLLKSGRGDTPLGKIRKDREQRAREKAKKAEKDEANMRHVMEWG